jgi:hypothetical protein
MTTIDEARENAARARRELEATLDALEDKLNLPKRIAQEYRRNPVLVIVVGIGIAAAAVGAIAWAIARRN